MKVALLHDWLIRFGGAERVLTVLHKMFPEAPVYFLVAQKNLVKSFFPNAEVRASFLDNLPGFFQKRHRFLLPLYPSAVESIDLSEFDLVISSSSTFIKGVVTRPHTVHISYIHTPPRFLWDWKDEYQETLGNVSKIISTPLFHYMRLWDKSAAMRPDHLIANSKTTRARIQKYYRRDASVIYPPVNLSIKYQVSGIRRQVSETSPDSYFLIVSQLVPYKRIDLAINVCNKLKLPLVIIGDGSEKRKFERMAGPTIKMLGWQSDRVVAEYYQNALAVIFPGEDDFGIVPVEAMSFGKPVLAYRAGGATESVIEGVTGEFFDEPTAESLEVGLEKILNNLDQYKPLAIQERAQEFSEDRFTREIGKFIDNRILGDK